MMSFWRLPTLFAASLSILLHVSVLGLFSLFPEPAPALAPTHRLNIKVAKVSKNIPVKIPQEALEKKPLPVKRKPKPKQVVKNKSLPNPLAKRKTPEPPPVEEVQADFAQREVEERRIAEQRSEVEAIRYEELIAGLIAKKKRYPRIARRRGQEGEGVIELGLLADGTLASLKVVKSSGASILDKEMELMVRRAQPFPPFPKEIRKTSVRFTAPIRFQLR